MDEIPAKSGFFLIDPFQSRVWRPFRKISEIHEARMVCGFANVLSRIDPLMSSGHSERIRLILKQEYQEMMQQCPEFLVRPGVSDLALNHLCGLPCQTEHYYAYVPDSRIHRRLGLLVFLHGNAGNLKIMTWRWKSLADKLGLAIVSPTNGFGFWSRESSTQVVQKCLTDVMLRWPQIQRNQGLWLAGLSDGGNGVTRSAAALSWDGLIYLSATMRFRDLSAPTFLESCKDRPILVLHGVKDHNVWPSSVRKCVDHLKSKGVKIDSEWYDREDHFLFFGAKERVDRRIEQWLGESRKTSEPA